MGSRAIWQGSLKFGSISLPVKLYSAVQDQSIHFHILESKTKTRIQQHMVNPETGWGFRDETFRAHDQLAAYGRPAWFHLGDRDLATHIHRTAMLREGATLSEAAESIRLALGVQAKILPMSDQPVPTMIDTEQGRLDFQQYLVQKQLKL